MGYSDDESVTFQSKALDVVGTWLHSGNADDDEKVEKKLAQSERRSVALYRPSSSSAPSLTRPNAADTKGTLTDQERDMRRKILKENRRNYAEEVEKAEKEEKKQQYDEQDEEEQELVCLKMQMQKNDKKRQRTAQDELLDKLRKEAAKKSAKNQKRKLQLQRKKRGLNLN